MRCHGVFVSCLNMPFYHAQDFLSAACRQLRHCNTSSLRPRVGLLSSFAPLYMIIQTIGRVDSIALHRLLPSRDMRLGRCRRTAATHSTPMWVTPSCPSTASLPLATPSQALAPGPGPGTALLHRTAVSAVCDASHTRLFPVAAPTATT